MPSQSPDEITFAPLTIDETTVDNLGWSGGPIHIDYVADAVRRSELGETDMIAGRDKDGRVVCYGGAEYSIEQGSAKLWMLIVRPELRGLGIGTKLVEALEAVASNKVSRVYLNVEKHNQGARRLYERLGYQVESESTESWYELDDGGERYLKQAQVFVMARPTS